MSDCQTKDFYNISYFTLKSHKKEGENILPPGGSSFLQETDLQLGQAFFSGLMKYM